MLAEPVGRPVVGWVNIYHEVKDASEGYCSVNSIPSLGGR